MATFLRHVQSKRHYILTFGLKSWNPKISNRCLHKSPVEQLLRRSHLKHGNLCVCSVLAVRYNSTASNTGAPQTLPPDYIPEPPSLLPDTQENAVEALNALGEPTLESLGLANWSPAGIIQMLLETIHVNLGIPWWSSIVLLTVTLRLCVFPVMVIVQRHSINFQNNFPKVMEAQQEFSEARRSGNEYVALKALQNLNRVQQEANIKFTRQFLGLWTQFCIFVPNFWALRAMASLPVDSMKTGGMMWFKDLTVTDPYFALPLATCATLLATLELGADGFKSSSGTPAMKWIMRGMPLVLLPIMAKFPAAILCYWFTSNVFSLCQVAFLKIPGMKTRLKIPKLDTSVQEKQKAEMQRRKKKGLRASWREALENARLQSSALDRQRADAQAFKKAGTGPVPKTYPYDPTKVNQGVRAASSKTKS